jgi:hypothetical protein
MLNRTHHVPVEKIDTQNYYVADCSEA